jgi:hypothetical protein
VFSDNVGSRMNSIEALDNPTARLMVEAAPRQGGGRAARLRD